MTVTRDGRTVDTLDNYRWPHLLGGESDGEAVPRPERSWKLPAITVGEETYFKRNQTFGPVRVVCFVAESWPRVAFWPYALLRRLFSVHPELESMPDIEVETKPEGDSKRG